MTSYQKFPGKPEVNKNNTNAKMKAYHARNNFQKTPYE